MTPGEGGTAGQRGEGGAAGGRGEGTDAGGRTDEPRLAAVGVGPQRTATTWLHACLAPHPELCLPRRVKETFFLDRRFDRGWDWYWAHFGDCPPGGLRAEIAPTLFDVPEAAARLREHNPTCRILASLRDPAERAVSLWLDYRRKGLAGASFREACRRRPEILEASRYAEHLPRWIEAFGRERVHVLLVDDVAERPEAVLGDVYGFLGVEPPEEPPPAARRRVYPGSLPRFPALARAAARAARWLRGRGLHWPLEAARKWGLRDAVFRGGGEGRPEPPPELRRELVAAFEEDVVYVEELMGRELPGWRAP